MPMRVYVQAVLVHDVLLEVEHDKTLYTEADTDVGDEALLAEWTAGIGRGQTGHINTAKTVMYGE